MRKGALCFENMSQDNVTTIFILPFVFSSREMMKKKMKKGSCGEKLYLPLSVVKNLCIGFDRLHLLEFFVIILPIWQCVFYLGHTRIGDFFVLV